jgi:hypothetical protein
VKEGNKSKKINGKCKAGHTALPEYLDLTLLRMVEIKPYPNHSLYLQTLRQMTPEQRLSKAFELSSITKKLFLHGLRRTFPGKTDAEIKSIYLTRIAKCHNRNY